MSEPSAEHARGWTGAEIGGDDWRVEIPDACHDEIDTLARRLERDPSPGVEHLDAHELELPECDRLMDRVRHRLAEGTGIALLDRIRIERYDESTHRALAWLIGNRLAPVVDQTYDGVRLYDVSDSGMPSGDGVRLSRTNEAQPLHTDGGWLPRPPKWVGLVCLQTAAEGGVNRIASLVHAHDWLGRTSPDLLERLYRPFWWDRQREHAPGAPLASRHPVFERDGDRIRGRFLDGYIRNGYALAGESIDAPGADAIAAMRDVLEQPLHHVELTIAPGQWLYLDNHACAHGRSGFTDAESSAPRHVLRIWHRSEGGTSLE